MRIGFPESTCADAVTAAAHALIPYGKNTAGERVVSLSNILLRLSWWHRSSEGA